MAGNRQANMIDMQLQPGLYMQRSKRQALGRYTDGNNVRWYRGLPQKHGGFQETLLVDENGTRVWYKGHARSCKTWDSLDGQNWIAFGTEYKLYVVNNGQLYDITPIRKTTTIVNGFSVVAGQLTITVTDPGHDAQEDDFVTFQGASAFANINLNKEFQISAVPDLDHYVIVIDVPASATVTNGGGTVLANYDWPSGLVSDGTLTGYGTGQYGEDTYGTARTDSTYGGYARIWSLDNWGEDLLASPNGDALFWWQRQLGPDSHAIIRPTAPANIERMLVGPDDRHVIALGTNLLSEDITSVTGQQDRMFVRWCTGDNFDDWVPQETAAETNDAGSKRLDLGSRLITACKTRTSVLIFSDEGLYNTALTGGLDVYSITPLGSSVRIISANAAVDVAGVVFLMHTKGFGKFDGTYQDIPCDIADFIFGSDKSPVLNRQMASKIYAEVRLDYFEVRWHFCSLDSEENDRVAIFNWQMQCWYVSDIARECSMDKNVFYGVPIGFSELGMWQEETGQDAGTEEPLFNYLETWEGEISTTDQHSIPQTSTIWGQSSGQWLLLVHSVFPDFKELEGSLTLQMRGREWTKSDQVFGELFLIDSTTDQADVQFCQRRVSVYVENYDWGSFWRMDEWRASGSPNGRR
jgi:hypothetical protein